MSETATWKHQPQKLWLRRALFQVHLWSGLAVGLYIVVISISGSILVYRSELRQTFEPACHEGNYGMDGTLTGARAVETKSE